jgi:hypothetical protein
VAGGSERVGCVVVVPAGQTCAHVTTGYQREALERSEFLVDGLGVVDVGAADPHAEECRGFGGTFAVKNAAGATGGGRAGGGVR